MQSANERQDSIHVVVGSAPAPRRLIFDAFLRKIKYQIETEGRK